MLAVIDEQSRIEAPGGRLAPTASCHVVVGPEALINAVLRAIDQAGARLALVTRNGAGGDEEVLGVITERTVARLAYAPPG
jgi:hypothetical protein